MRKLFCSFLILGLLVVGAGAAYAQNNPLTDTVKDLYGTPYKASGTTPKGFDCSGFTRYVFDALGVDLPHSSAAQYEIGTSVAKSELQPGDLVFFQTNGRSVSHVGIYIGDNTFVHSESSHGVMNTKLDEAYWKKRFVGAKRVEIPALTAAKEESNNKKVVQAASLETNPTPKKK
ncbi:C40 family peptidase [Brevibacillus fluminis]|uniref:C40 family peptidase n=1 Tax=Brevibacillus fluminis TaxID=511487 RepID=UPI003F8CBF8C